MKFNKNNFQIITLIISVFAVVLTMLTFVQDNPLANVNNEMVLSLAIALITLLIFSYTLIIIKRINPKKYIYISYTSADKNVAIKIAEILNDQLRKLSKYRYEVTTAESISYGENMKESMRRFINEADLIIVVVSECYIKSEWCIEEINTIMGMKKRIIPIVTNSFEDLVKMPHGLSDVKALSIIDCKTDADFEKRLVQLAKDLIKQRRD